MHREGDRSARVSLHPSTALCAASQDLFNCFWVGPANCRERSIGKNVIFASCRYQGDLGRCPSALLVPMVARNHPPRVPAGGVGAGCGKPFPSSGFCPPQPEARVKAGGGAEAWGQACSHHVPVAAGLSQQWLFRVSGAVCALVLSCRWERQL